MLRATARQWMRGNNNLKQHPNILRRNKRRQELEDRRVSEAHNYIPPVEPTPAQARALYRHLLKTGKSTLRFTDLNMFQRKVRHEFEVTSRKTSSRVRGLMYEKGMWMLQNKL
eukprot:PhF_6_TR20396/c0_g2_i1/m.29370